MRKILFSLVTFCLSLSAVAFDFSSVSPSGHMLHYSIVGNAVSVTFPGTSGDYYPAGTARPADTLVIPDTVSYQGVQYPVTAIADHAFDSCDNLLYVALPSTISSIGDFAFSHCLSMTWVDMQSGLESIGAGAFSFCTALETVVLPSPLSVIGANAFDMCGALRHIELPSTLTTISENAFRYCMALDSIALPNSLTSIGTRAFYGCSALTNVDFGNSITEIGVAAFSDCYALRKLVYPSSMTYVPRAAFHYCTSIDSLFIPSSVVSIETDAFSYCSALQKVTIPESVREIAGHAFAYMQGVSVVDYNATNCVSMGRGGDGSFTPVFEGCYRLRTINIGSNVRNIPECAFMSLASLENVNIYAENCEAMGSDSLSAFRGCGSLANVAFGENVTRVPSNAFRDCANLRRITLSESIATIGAFAFSGARLSEITCLSSTPAAFTDSIHAGINLRIPVFVNCGDAETYHNNEYWQAFSNIQEFNGNVLLVDSYDIDQGTVTVVHAPDCEDNTAIIRADAKNLYSFSHWSDGDTENPRSLSVTSDTSFIAYFEFTGEIHDTTTTAVPTVEEHPYHVLVVDGNIMVNGASNSFVTIMDIVGRVIVRGQAVENKKYRMPAPGIYLVKVGNAPATKVVVQ